ncbi:protein MLP1-like isoform X2 [Harmonia axyridis]|nr:protein MLP1-like isoform X2 [Harmonia axyridis]XP_045469131.1 protein MLP1-like isoform X2 [Harmonia axyridis]
MATEKSSLALKLGEQKGQIHSLQHQIENLKMYQEQSSLQLEQLTEENTALRNRLRDVAHSPLSDNEKQQLLYESHRHHNSAPASIATNPMEDGNCGDVTACPTPDWDKNSSSNVSEISVACLQDKINQMQETHYSTNEELQATLQELNDLQGQLGELQKENERLVEEKNLMFDSLCRQTERLKDTRQEVESLKTHLYRDQNETGLETAQEREEKLVDLLKSAQDEHESLLSKHEQLSEELHEMREANDALHDQLKVMTERNGTLESTLDAKQAEHKLLDQELAMARDQCNGKQIEVNRLKDLLENARTKINELEQDRALSDKSELDEMLDNARKEKDALESEVAHLKEQLARSKNEIERLKEQISILQEECKVTRNNARTIQSDLEYKYDKLASEKATVTEQLHKLQDIINDLQVQAQCQEEDKRNLSDVLAETQRNLSESERKILMLENDLADVKKLRKDENEEWEKFQNDLLTSVRVANDFKTEAQQDLQKMIMENKEHRDKVRQLEAQLDKLKGVPAMPEERRNSQQLPKQNAHRRMFGSLPSLLDIFNDKEQADKVSKRPKWIRHQKKLSEGEEKILESLHEMYNEIDPEKPSDMLTSEQAYIKKLKTLYEDNSTAYKPVAPRKKHDLAISKPLLESVYSNPKLESIAKNPNLKNLESDRFSWMGYKQFSDDQTNNKEKKDLKSNAVNIERFVSYLPSTPEVSSRTSSSEQRRVSSMDNTRQFPLRRYSSKEDLTGIAELESFKDPSNKIGRKRSSLKSIHSDTSSNISNKKRVSFDEKRNSCVVIKEFLSFGSLEDIYKKIDPKLPESQLTKEQRFAIRLKTSMENLGQKPELRKRPTFKKSKVIISSPLKESVLKNTKLLSIFKDPVVRVAGKDTELETVELRKVHRMKKYLADVNRVLRNPTKTMCKKDSRLSRSLENLNCFPYVFNRISSSMENLPSEGGIEPQVELKVVTKILPAKNFAASFNISSSSSSVDNSIENLIEKTEETPVVFIEHFESENKNRDSNKCVSTVEDSTLHIEDISEDCNQRKSASAVDDDDEYTGRISFPEEEGEVCRMRLLSINSVEMEEEDDVLARYKRISEYIEECSDKESYVERGEEDSQSLYTVELTNAEDYIIHTVASVEPIDEEKENWLTKYLDETCDIEEKKENRKMRVLYKDVVQEIKRKYSQDQHCSSESSDEEGIHILNTKEGKIEVRRSSEDEESEDNMDSNFLDRFFKTNHSFPQLNVSPIGTCSTFGNELNVQKSEKDDCVQERFVEQQHPTQEEMDYIMNVRKTYKDEFEDVDRLGNTNVESDYNRKYLCRQNYVDYDDYDVKIQSPVLEDTTPTIYPVDKVSESKQSVLSTSDLDLLSSIEKRHSRALSDINMNDLAFIESMKDKYLKIDDSKTIESSQNDTAKEFLSMESEPINVISLNSSTSYSEYDLKYLTRDFLTEEMSHHSDFWGNDNSDSRSSLQIHTNENNSTLRYIGQKSDSISPYSSKNSEFGISYSYFYSKLLTENFLKEEKKHSSCSTNGKIFPSGNINQRDARYFDCLGVQNNEFLKKSTLNFLTQEINYNTYSGTISRRSDKNSSVGEIVNPHECKGEVNDSRKESESTRLVLNPPCQEFVSNAEFILRNPKDRLSRTSTDCDSWLYYEPVYTNCYEFQPRTPINVQSKPRKPKPLPRKFCTDDKLTLTTIDVNVDSSVTRTFDNVQKVKNEPHEELLPNSSKVMNESNDVVRMKSRSDKILQDSIAHPSKEPSVSSLAKCMDGIGSSNVMVRKTKKFIKEGDLVEEFDEAAGVYNVRLENILDNEKFDTKNQIIPEALIDYADSESKVTLIDVDNGFSDFQEPCSRPQTSRQRSTPFRLSYYGETSEEGVDSLKEATSRTSVSLLKQKFENLVTDNDETDTNSVVIKEFRESQKANLAKLLNEKAAYDLVFKTESKYWFDNTSEADRPETPINTSAPSFESAATEKPLNITILDPIESKTNANYQHLFESGTVSKNHQKPFVGNVKLSELNLKTSIPCVDFTTLNNPMVERESNASLYNFGLGSEGSSGADAATSCLAKDE